LTLSPAPALQAELPERGQLLGRQGQPVAGDVQAVRVLLPGRRGDAERLEQPGPQVVEQPLAGEPLHDRADQVRGPGVVDGAGAGLVLDGLGQQLARPSAAAEPKRAQGVAGVPAGHGQQVPYGHRCEVRRWVGRGVVGEQIHHAIIQREEPFLDGQPHGHRRDTLADREQHVRPVQGVRRPGRLGHHVPAAHHHERVHGIDRAELVDEQPYGGGIQALGGRGGTREDRGHPPILPAGAGWRGADSAAAVPSSGFAVPESRGAWPS
jgi:hypothetical protein